MAAPRPSFIGRPVQSPVLVIEVDGFAFHREGTRQAERDTLKDSVLEKCGLPILRLSTVGSDERNRIRNKLAVAVGGERRAH
jgi:very-short-patch-repair endonuclease